MTQIKAILIFDKTYQFIMIAVVFNVLFDLAFH